MAYTPLTPIGEKKSSVIPEAYIPLSNQPEEYFQELQNEITEKVAVKDFKIEDTQESDIKDIWDAFYLGARNMLHKSKQFFLNALPNMVFKERTKKDILLESVSLGIIGPQLLLKEKDVVKINERNKVLKDAFKKAYVHSEEKHQEWIDAHPKLQPRPEYEGPVLENLKKNPKLLTDPGYWGTIAAESASFTIGVIGTTLAVGFATKNPLLAMGAGVAVATPLQTQDLYEDLVLNGATESQAADLSRWIGPVIASVEVIGDIPILKAIGGSVFSKILTRNIQKQVAKKTMSYLAKQGLKTFTQIEIAETLEEILQGVIQDATVKTVNENRSILKNIPETTIRTLIATLPFALIGGGSAIRQEAKTTPEPEMEIEEQPAEITFEEKEKEFKVKKEREAMIVVEEEIAIKQLKEAKTGVPIVIAKSYSGIKGDWDSGFRTVERSYAQGYADMKKGIVKEFTNEALSNPFVTESHKTALDYLEKKFPEEVVKIRKEYDEMVAKQYKETGKMAAPPDIVKPTDDFIREKLEAEGYDSLVYAKDWETEYQIFSAVSKVAPEAKKVLKEEVPVEKGVKPSIKEEFKVGDILNPQGHTNMVGNVRIKEITGNTLKFIDSEGTEFSGMQRSIVRKLISEGSWKKVIKEEKPEIKPIVKEIYNEIKSEKIVEEKPEVKPEAKTVLMKSKATGKTREVKIVKEMPDKFMASYIEGPGKDLSISFPKAKWEIVKPEEKPLTKPKEVAKIKEYGGITKEIIEGGRRELGREELPGALPVGKEEPTDTGAEIEGVSKEDLSGGSNERRTNVRERSGTQSINKQIEELVEKKGDDSTKYTDEEKNLLRQYTGSGGLETSGAEGRGLLDEYFTPEKVVNLTWRLVGEQTDLTKSLLEILEPSIGIGSFLLDKKQLGHITTGYEISEISSKIAKVLMPDAQIYNKPFEDIFIDDRGNKKKFEVKYDVVIGNPPYGEHRGKYKGLGEEPKIKKYEYYFIKKALDLTKENGIVAMVIPSQVLRGAITSSSAKLEIAKMAELVDARRLPNGTFAFTDIGTDILVFKKNTITDEKEINVRLNTISNNAFFDKNPEKIIGKEEERIGRFGPEKYVVGSLKGMENEVELHEAEIETPHVEKIIDSKTEDINVPDGDVEIGSGRANIDTEQKENVNERIVIVSDKKEKTITFKNEAVSTKEEKIWNDILPTGELSEDALTGIDVNYMDGKWYNDFNYLQGNIYEKLEYLEKDKDTIDTAQYDKQKKALQDILPIPQKLEDITITPNSDFAKDIKIGKEELVKKFETYLYELPHEAFKSSSEWEVENYIDGRIVNSDDKKLNAEIRRRRRLIGNELFKRFIAEELSDTEKKEIIKIYNETYNAYHKPNYDQVPTNALVNGTFKGKPLRLHPHQFQGIGFMVNKGVGTLAWDVGWGKTLASIMSINELMHKGWTKKPLIVVPNGVYHNWIRELKEVIPNVKINSLVNLGGKFKGDLKTLEIPEGSVSILTYDGMRKLGFKPETYQKLLVDLQDVMAGVNTTKRGQAKDKEKIAEAIGRAARKTTTERFFEDLGFDFVVIDEVQNFKNIFAGAKIKGGNNEFRNVRGSTSERGIKAYIMAQYVLGQNNGRGVMTLSATPFTNSPMEIYSVLSLMAKRRLEELKIKNVNDFMNLFMRLEPRFQVKANRTVKDEDVIESFYNLQQLQKLISEYIDFRSGKTEGFTRPNKSKRKIVLKPNQTQIDYLDEAQALFEDKDAGGAIVAITEQQNITLSPYLSRYNKKGFPKYKEFVENSPKLKQAIEAIRQIKKDKPEVGQVLYMPRGTQFYRLVKEYLIKVVKYKPEQVSMIFGGMSIDAKQLVQDKFNAGKIKIIIGSEAMKEGVNLQENTTELHHLHLPWNPTDLLQVEGRIWRQNNQWKNVRIHYYLIENSIDQFIFQKLETKEKRIKNIWSYTGDEIEVGDLNFEEMKLDLITDPVVKAKAEETFEIAKKKDTIDTLLSEKAFLFRKIEKIDDIEKRIKGLTGELKTEPVRLKDDGFSEKEIADEIKDIKRSISKFKRNLVIARRNLHGVDETEIKHQIKEKEKLVNIHEKELEEIGKKFEKEIKAAEEIRIEQIAKPNDYADYAFQLADENKTFFEKISVLKEKPVKPKFIGEGGREGAAMGEFREDYPVELGNLDKVRPIEFIELVSIARELSGKFPKVKALPKSLGIQKGLKITLNKNLFEKGNQKDLAKVLAHELGHLTDFLPDLTMSRGNLLGRLLTLQNFLKNTFGEMEITNKELKEELTEVSEWWRPYDKKASSESFIKYRNSSKELYADAISLLFNSPGTLEKMAPNFYREFFANLDEKPEVRKTFFDLQEILSEGENAIISKRDKEIRNMFKKGEDLFKIKEEEREARRRNYWFVLRYEMIDKNQAILDLVEKTKKQGGHINDDENPVYYLEEHNYLGGKLKQFIQGKIDPIFKDLEDNEISWEDFGVVMFLNRVITERADLANPLGYTPDSAEKQLNSMREKMGEEVFGIINRNVEKFRDNIKEVMQEGYDVGLYKPELYKQMIENPAYATFQVLDHLQETIPAGIKHQIGTLKEISNPATATIIKIISTIRAIERNKVTKVTKEFLKNNHSDEIKPAKKIFNGKIHVPIESQEPGEELVIYMDKGNVEGMYVDPYIADSLKRNTIGQNNAIVRALRLLNSKVFRPLFITYNPGFQLFNLVRDFVRAYKNTPGMSLLNLVKLYGQSFKHARARGFHHPDELIAEMEKSQILSITYNDIVKGRDRVDEQIDNMMLHYGVLDEKPSRKNPALRIIMPILDFIEHTGNLVETLPKVVGYKFMSGKLPPKEMGSFVRTRIGSPDFLRRGHGYSWYNELFLFSNAIKEGVRADMVTMFKDPNTRSGFWWKTGKLVFVPKLLMFAALLGLAGDDMKEAMMSASEYDRANYIIIPLGKDENGKWIYFRLPQDETGRIIGGLFWKGLNLPVSGIQVKELPQILAYTGGQLPSITPSIDAAQSVMQFLSGQNPYDFFRGRNVLSDKEFAAGGKYALIPFLKWQWNQLGGGTFMRFEVHEYTPREKSQIQIGLNSPIVSNVIGRFIKTTDYGISERMKEVTAPIEQERAVSRIEENRVINRYIKKFQDTGSKQEDIEPLIKEATKEAFKGQIKTKGEIRYFQKKFKVAILRGKSDPLINALIYAQSSDSQIALLKEYKNNMSKDEFNDLFKFLQEQKIISPITASKFFKANK